MEKRKIELKEKLENLETFEHDKYGDILNQGQINQLVSWIQLEKQKYFEAGANEVLNLEA